MDLAKQKQLNGTIGLREIGRVLWSAFPVTAGGEKFVTVAGCNGLKPLPAEVTVPMNIRWKIIQISTTSIVGSEGSSLKLFSPCKHATPQGRRQETDGYQWTAL
jgi:hypothetical protein